MQHRILALWVVLAAGCSSDRVPTYPVNGQVVFENGNPVRHGKIELESREYGTTATGTIDQNGRFVLGTYTADDGAVAGEHDAIVVQMVIADGSFEHTIDHGDPAPARYATYEKSPLTVSVAPDSNNTVTITISK